MTANMRAIGRIIVLAIATSAFVAAAGWSNAARTVGSAGLAQTQI